MEQRAITQMEKSKKMAKADEKFRQAQAQYAKAVKDENDRIALITFCFHMGASRQNM